MNNDNTLSAKLTRIETAVGRIRTKTDTATDTIENVATAVEGLVSPSGNINITNMNTTNVANYATAQVVDSNLTAGNIKKDVSILGVTGTLTPGVKSNIYKVSSTSERDTIDDMVEGDMCVVYGIDKHVVQKNESFNKAEYPSTVTLSTAISRMKNYYSSDNKYTFRATATYANISYRGTDSTITVKYTSSDGLTYTRTDVLGNPISYENNITFTTYYNDLLTNFITTVQISFPGIFTYTNNAWVQTEIGANAVASNILTGNKAYTDIGMLSGTRDINTYNKRHVYIQNTEPTDTKGLWCTTDNMTFDVGARGFNTTVGDVTQYVNCTYLGSDSKSKNGWINLIDGVTYIDRLTYSSVSYGLSGPVINNKLYGYYIGTYSSTFYNQGKIYNFSTDTTSSMATMPNTANTYAHICYYYDKNNTIYAFVYDTNTSDIYLYSYSVSGNSWSRVKMVSGFTGISYSSGYTYGMVLEGKAYLKTQDNSDVDRIRFLIYDIANNTSSVVDLAETDLTEEEIDFYRRRILCPTCLCDIVENSKVRYYGEPENIIFDFAQLSTSYVTTFVRNISLSYTNINNAVVEYNGIYYGVGSYFLTMYNKTTGETKYINLVKSGGNAGDNYRLPILDGSTIKLVSNPTGSRYSISLTSLPQGFDVYGSSTLGVLVIQTADTGKPIELLEGITVMVKEVLLRGGTNSSNMSSANKISAIYYNDGAQWQLYKQY